MSDILLINPRTELDISSRKFNREPPSGILILCSVLKNLGYKVDFIDLSIEKEARLKILLRNKPSLIGITALTNTFPLSIRILKKIKELDPKLKTVIGGPHVSFQAEEALSIEEIDYVIIGEGEQSLPLLLNKLLKKNSVTNIPGVAYKENNETFICNQSLPINLDEIPLPARNVLKVKYEVADIIVNRGCPYQCSFCVRQKLFQDVRIRNPKSVIDEIYQVIEFNYEYFNLYDNINISNQFVDKFCSEMIKNQVSLPWGCELRIDLLSKELASKLAKAGAIAIATGIESGSREVLQINNKNQDLELIRKGIYNAKQVKLSIQAYFIIGLPGETKETFQRTKEFINSINLEPGIDRINFFIATPYPGSDLYQNQKKYGIDIIEKNFEFWDCEHIIFETNTLTKKEIKEMVLYGKQIEKIYAERN
ncbi:MAG: B12-binding domain-containing radical SAM protein [Candidatus Helarchaeota archaeon]|nr:B12-binding domain-containing radical SAM protein [Candidatus Helarchaeota archaeon]